MKFSIVIPTYNRAWCIERAISSVLKQNFQDWEMIIVDDGSTDNTKKVLEKYLNKYKNIKYFYKENGGVGSARNLGIKKAQGDYLIFLDSDDELTKNALKFIREKTSENKEVNLFAFKTIGFNKEATCYIRKSGKLINFHEYISGKYIKGESLIVCKKEIFKNNTYLFDEEFKGGGAVGILIWQLIIENGLMIYNRVVRIYYTNSPDSLINSKLDIKKINNIYRVQKKLINKFKKNLKIAGKNELGSIYFVLARSSALLNKKLESIKYFFLGIYYKPFDLKRILLYSISLFDYNMILNNFLIYLYNKIKNK